MKKMILLLTVLSLVQLLMAIFLRGKITPIINDPFLLQAILFFLLSIVGQKMTETHLVYKVLKWAAILTPLVFLFPYLSMLQYFINKDYLLIAWMALASIFIAIYKPRI